MIRRGHNEGSIYKRADGKRKFIYGKTLDTPLGLMSHGFSVLWGCLRNLSPKALPKPLYVPGGVVIPMQAGATIWTGVPADG